jgi:cytochrome c-type biogenesis protein CcmH
VRRLQALAAIFAGALCLAAAADPADRLPDPAQEARARAIMQDVRCLVCQNESIHDSEAELAADLRKVVREQVQAGHSDVEVKRFLTDRYGEFVLLTPAVSWMNLALGGAPFAVVILGAGLLFSRLRNRSGDVELSSDEAERVRRLSETDPA